VCGEEADEKEVGPYMTKLVSELIKSKPKLFSKLFEELSKITSTNPPANPL